MKVIVAKNTSRRAYHTDRECAWGPENGKELDLELAEAWGLTECGHCNGGLQQGENPEKPLAKRIRDGEIDV